MACAEDVVPRLLASPAQSPQQVADATIVALQNAEGKALGDKFVEATIDLFEDVFDAAVPPGPLVAPGSHQHLST